MAQKRRYMVDLEWYCYGTGVRANRWEKRTVTVWAADEHEAEQEARRQTDGYADRATARAL
jgi:hypothetical protein